MGGELMTELLSSRPKFQVSMTLLEVSKAGYKGRKNKQKQITERILFITIPMILLPKSKT